MWPLVATQQNIKWNFMAKKVIKAMQSRKTCVGMYRKRFQANPTLQLTLSMHFQRLKWIFIIEKKTNNEN